MRDFIAKWFLQGWLERKLAKLPFNGYKSYLTVAALLLADYIATTPNAAAVTLNYIYELMIRVGAYPSSIEGTLLAFLALTLFHKGLKLVKWIVAKVEGEK